MNKYITLFAALLLGVFVHAQAPRGFYLAAGPNTTSLKSDDLLADPGTGFRAGINFNMGYHETYNYQFEIMYNQSSLEFLAVDQNYEKLGNAKYSFNTIDIGFFFNYYIIKPEEGRFFIGPQAGLNAAFAGKFEQKSGSQDELYLPHLIDEGDFDEMPKVALGAGVGLTGGYNDFRFDLRYTLGLTNLLSNVQTNSFDENNQYTGPALEGKLNTVSFTISYRVNKLFGGE